MAILTIIASIRAKPEHVESVKAQLQGLIPLTLAEEGCIQYDLHQDNEDPAHFLFYENWASRDHWQAHMKTAHLAAYAEATKETVASVTIYEMTHLPK